MAYFESASTVVDRPVAKLDAGGEPFWSREKPIMDDKGRLIRGGMWEPQARWWAMPNFVRAFIGGYGCGKTNLLGKRSLSLALQNAPIPVGVVSPTLVMAKRTTVPTIKDFLNGKQQRFGARAFWWKYNATDHIFRVRYRGRSGEIQVYSGEDPDSLKGPNLAAALIDEPFIQDVAVFTQMIARIRHPASNRQELDLFGTPEQLNWGYDLCTEGGELRKLFDVGVVHASTRSNLVLGGGYVSRLEGAYTGKAAEAYIEGQFANLSTGLVFYGFTGENQAEMVPNEQEHPELVAGMDFNVNPMAMVVAYRIGDHLHFIDEFELPNADTEFACSILREKYWDRGLRKVYPDATGSARKTSAPGAKSDFWYIKQAGFEVHANNENPKVRESFNIVNGRLNPKVGKPKITISKNCPKLRKYLNTYSYELLNKDAQKKMRHLIDSFRYIPSYLFPIVREVIVQQALSGF